MSHFDDIYEIAADNYGVVTYAEAHGEGVQGTELSRWVSSGRLERVGHGVYRLTRWVPTGRERYAEALALVGPGAVLWGESVLALLGLAYVNPGVVCVAPGRRVRRKLPSWVRVTDAPVVRRGSYEGIACQDVAEAILACRGRVLTGRLRDAADEAARQGYVTKRERDALRGELT